MKPTVGRIVHYYPYEGDFGGSKEPLAAIVVDIPPATFKDQRVKLAILVPHVEKVVFLRREYNDTPRPGYWSWPVREGDTKKEQTI